MGKFASVITAAIMITAAGAILGCSSDSSTDGTAGSAGSAGAGGSAGTAGSAGAAGSLSDAATDNAAPGVPVSVLVLKTDPYSWALTQEPLEGALVAA